MSGLTEQEWEGVLTHLVRGGFGLREYLDSLIISKRGCFCDTVGEINRLFVYRAYDDGMGNTVNLRPGSVPGHLEGFYDGEFVVEITEIDGILYSICVAEKSFSVLVDSEIVDNVVGPMFKSRGEARAYILGLTKK